MDETGVLIGAVTITAATVGAFWVRTESVREEIRKWVDDKYMTRESVNLRFGAVEALLNEQSRKMLKQDEKLDAMNRAQSLQLQYLRQINGAVGSGRLETHSEVNKDASNET
jgi:uncharacterized transporter YbjL